MVVVVVVVVVVQFVVILFSHNSKKWQAEGRDSASQRRVKGGTERPPLRSGARRYAWWW